MRVLVIGGTAFIGPPVVRRLAEQGHEVTVFHRGKTEAELPPSVRHIHHDWDRWAEPSRLGEFVAEFRRISPDVVLETGRMVIKAKSATDSVASNVSILAVWRLEEGKWRFFAWQSAKLPAPAK